MNILLCLYYTYIKISIKYILKITLWRDTIIFKKLELFFILPENLLEFLFPHLPTQDITNIISSKKLHLSKN